MLHFLLAEDNLGDILLVQKSLEEHHVEHELHIVRDGAEALDLMTRMGHPGEAPCPDLMLLDLNLPKVDGPQVLSEFRKHPECGHTPVIIVSSADSQNDRARLAKYGISRYFRKPSDHDSYLELGAIVLEVVGDIHPADRPSAASVRAPDVGKLKAWLELAAWNPGSRVRASSKLLMASGCFPSSDSSSSRRFCGPPSFEKALRTGFCLAEAATGSRQVPHNERDGLPK